MTTNRVITFAKEAYSEDLVPAKNGIQPKPLAGMNSGQLLSLYNLVASNLGRGAVKRFADNKAGAKRTWKLLCEWADQPEEPVVAEVGQGSKVVQDTSKPNSFKVKFSETDKKQIADEKAARKPAPKPTPQDAAEELMKVASAQQKKVAAQAALRANPPSSKNATKDAEMPALRRTTRPVSLAPKKTVYPRRAGSKQALLVDLLSRPEGATFGELYDAMASTGKPWRGVTIRSGLAWDMNHVAGYGVSSEMFNGQQFAEMGREYEAHRLGWNTKKGEPTEGYDPELKLAVYHLAYPSGMDAPLPHNGKDKA